MKDVNKMTRTELEKEVRKLRKLILSEVDFLSDIQKKIMKDDIKRLKL
jgi:hypothetical protein